MNWTGFRCTRWALLLTALSALTGLAQQPAPSAEATPTDPHKAFVSRYCVACHNERLRMAGLKLDKANLDTPGVDSAIWEKVVRKLRAGQIGRAHV